MAKKPAPKKAAPKKAAAMKATPKKAAAPKKPQPNRYRLHERPYTGSNFGLIHFSWDGPNPALRLEIRGLAGEVVISREIPFSEIRRQVIPRGSGTSVQGGCGAMNSGLKAPSLILICSRIGRQGESATSTTT